MFITEAETADVHQILFARFDNRTLDVCRTHWLSDWSLYFPSLFPFAAWRSHGDCVVGKHDVWFPFRPRNAPILHFAAPPSLFAQWWQKQKSAAFCSQTQLTGWEQQPRRHSAITTITRKTTFILIGPVSFWVSFS